MLVFCCITTSEGVRVAGTTDITLLAFEHTVAIAGMRRMACGTAVFPILDQMIMGRRHLRLNIVVTAEAGINADRDSLAFMAVIATFGIGWMQNVLDHPRPIAAMGVMTGSTIFHFHREIGMLLLDILRRVTTLAELLDGFREQIIVSRLMRVVADGALPLGVGWMRMLELLWKIRMAGKTEVGTAFLEQFIGIRGMGTVANDAFPLAHRLMHFSAFADLIGQVIVTGKTQLRHLLLKQGFVPRCMGAVAGKTILLGDRLMLNFFIKSAGVMTHETIHLRLGVPTLMAVGAISGGKRRMLLGIE